MRTVVVASDLTVALSGDAVNLDLAVTEYLLDCDYVIVEGLKQAPIPKIVVISEGEEMPSALENVVAAVGAPVETVPTFALDQIGALGEFLLQQEVLKPPAQRVALLVNGKPVRLNEFVRSSLSGVIRGFVASLKDIDQPHTIHLTLRDREERPGGS
jgi:hypothetical protein